jgi:hypothetical protein
VEQRLDRSLSAGPHREEGLDDVAEPGRKLAARLRLHQSLTTGARALEAAQKGLALHRMATFVRRNDAGFVSPAVFGARRANGQVAPARNVVTVATTATAWQAFSRGNPVVSQTAGASGPGGGGDRRDRWQAQVASPQQEASRQGRQIHGGIMNRVKLHWHDGAGRPGVARQARPDRSSGEPLDVAAPGGRTGESGGAPGGRGGLDARQTLRDIRVTPGLTGAAPAAGTSLREPTRHFRAATAQAAKGQTAPRLSGRIAGALQAPARSIGTVAMAPTGRGDSPAMAGPPAAVAKLPEQPGRPAVPPGSQSGTRGPAEADGSAGGTGAADRQGPAQGDVYLDGRLVGRWMAQSLAAQAGRPANGSAGFDPRRNVFPTGAMIGG